jgi:tRNA A37 methylthiotransferase MiaB
MELQQTIAFENARAQIGQEEVVMVDAAAHKDAPALCRSRRDAPEVDAGVRVFETQSSPGTFLKVRITDVEGYDLIARPALESLI